MILKLNMRKSCPTHKKERRFHVISSLESRFEGRKNESHLASPKRRPCTAVFFTIFFLQTCLILSRSFLCFLFFFSKIPTRAVSKLLRETYDARVCIRTLIKCKKWDPIVKRADKTLFNIMGPHIKTIQPKSKTSIVEHRPLSPPLNRHQPYCMEGLTICQTMYPKSQQTHTNIHICIYIYRPGLLRFAIVCEKKYHLYFFPCPLFYTKNQYPQNWDYIIVASCLV